MRHCYTVDSLCKRILKGIMCAYAKAIVPQKRGNVDARRVAEDYLETVNAKIGLFLRGKTKIVRFHLEKSDEDFPKFWDKIGAQGDMERALGECAIRHNASS